MYNRKAVFLLSFIAGASFKVDYVRSRTTGAWDQFLVKRKNAVGYVRVLQVSRNAATASRATEVSGRRRDGMLGYDLLADWIRDEVVVFRALSQALGFATAPVAGSDFVALPKLLLVFTV